MDLTKVGRTEQVLSGAGLLAFIFGFLPWYGGTIEGYTQTFNAWGDYSGFIDWLPILLLFIYGIILFLPALGVQLNVPVLASDANRAFIGLVLAVLGVVLWAIQGLTYPSLSSLTGGATVDDLGVHISGSVGPQWGYYVVLVIGLAAAVQSYLGFTKAGGSLAQVGASFKARTQAIQQQPGQPYGAPPQAGDPSQQPYGVPPQADPSQQPYGQQPQPPYGQPPAPPAGS
jgi:hypothetical protein